MTRSPALLENSELRELSRVSGWRTTFSIVLDWLMIASGFAASGFAGRDAWARPLIWILVFVFMGRQQLALAILMHDGAHRRLYRSGRLNEWVGQFVLAAPLLFSMDSYRRLHLKHHLDPLVPDDPDLSLIGGYPISRASFFRKILRDLLGISYFKFIRYFVYMARRKGATGVRPGQGDAAAGFSRAWVFASIAVAQATILTVLSLLGHPVLYFTLWLLPAMTILQVLLRIRGIAEHAGYLPNRNQMLNARTVINPLQTFLFAPHHVNYHIEHHVYPSVPFHRLPEVHRVLRARGALPEANLYRGYGQVLAELVR